MRRSPKWGAKGCSEWFESLQWKHQVPRLLKAYADTVGSEKQLAASDVALRESEK